jgi:hypothetical protein
MLVQPGFGFDHVLHDFGRIDYRISRTAALIALHGDPSCLFEPAESISIGASQRQVTA